MLGRKKNLEEKLFYPSVSLEKRIPEGHLLRRIKEQIDFDFVRDEVAELYGRRGNPSIDPVVLLKLMLLLFLEGVKSERSLVEQMSYRLDWMWFCNYDLDEQPPDHSVLSKARRRWGLEIFGRFFQRVLRQCVQAGLVDGEQVHVDSSVIRANASLDSLEEIGRGVYRQLDESSEEEREDDPDKGDSSGKANADRKSSTDPEADLTRRNGKTVLGYQEHRVVDDRCGVITATETTKASVKESKELPGLLDSHRWNTGKLEKTVVADRGYGTREVYRNMRDRGVRPCIPHQRWGRTSNTYSSDRFEYDKENDSYVCPAGNPLHRSSRSRGKTGRPVRYYANGENCAKCAQRSECTKNPNGRTMIRHPDQHYVEWADRCFSPQERKRLQGRRRYKAEGSFADAANNHGFKRSRWRGLTWMKIQNLLIATVQNIRKLMCQRATDPKKTLGKALCAPKGQNLNGLIALICLSARICCFRRPVLMSNLEN